MILADAPCLCTELGQLMLMMLACAPFLPKELQGIGQLMLMMLAHAQFVSKKERVFSCRLEHSG